MGENVFTGIIEEKGKVREKNGASLVIEASTILDDLKIGQSVAVNGVCLTVVNFTREVFSVEVMPHTLRLTNLSCLNKGSWVNLERPARLGDHLGGHLLSGHIDGLARLVEKIKEGNAWLMRFVAPSSLSKYMVKQGSIALDGISLTILGLSENGFSVSIIPHTLKMTTLGEIEPGDEVNIEIDMVAKYIERLLGKEKEGISQRFLKEHGFV